MGRNMHELEALGGVHAPKLSDFWTWVNNAFTPSYKNEIEAYLSESTDLFDLENRQESLVRRGMI